MDLSFVLVNHAAYPRPEAVIDGAAERGITVSFSQHHGDGPMVFDIQGGGALMVMLVEAPHPDVPNMATGPLSPPPEQLAAAQAHYIVTALELSGTTRERDGQMASLTAAIVEGCDAAGVMLGHGVMFHHPALFADLAKTAAEENELPVLICVDVTVARDSEHRMSFLSHGMRRYGREELLVSAPIEGHGALDFLLDMMRWLVLDPDKHLPTGDTVGRSEDERILIERVPSPLAGDPNVIRLELP